MSKRDVTASLGRPLVVCVALLLTAWVSACPVCRTMPEQTAADRLLESDAVVLARLRPDDPFRYRAVEILKGTLATPDVDLFANTVIRRKLSRDPDAVVLLVREAPESWHVVAIPDGAYITVAREILDRAARWATPDGQSERVAYFAQLFGHENPDLFDLAYLELGKAPYSTIRTVARRIDPSTLQPMVRGLWDIEWRSLAILMLSVNGTEADHRAFDAAFDGCRRHGLTLDLAAYATSAIERHEAAAVEIIERDYLRDAGRTEEEIRAVLTALSVHGQNGHTHLRDRIIAAYASALRTHPAVVGPIARDAVAWHAWTLRDDVTAALDVHQDLADEDAWAVRQFLRALPRTRDERLAPRR